MSHFNVAVFSRDPSEIEDMLAPFGRGSTASPFFMRSTRLTLPDALIATRTTHGAFSCLGSTFIAPKRIAFLTVVLGLPARG